MRGRRGTVEVVEGALLASLTVIFVLAGTYLPLVGGLLLFLWPVPIVVLVVRHGFRMGLLAVAVAGLILGMLVPPVEAVLMVAAFAPVGLALGLGVRRRYPAFAVILLGGAAGLVSLGVTVGVSLLFLRVNPLAVQVDMLRQSLAQAAGFYRRLGVGEEQLALLEEQSRQIAAVMGLFLPASLLVASLAEASLNYGISGFVLRRLRHPWVPLPPFSRWRVPKLAVAIYLAALGLALAGARYGLEPLQIAAQNLYFVFVVVFLVQGLAVAWFFLGRYHVPAAFRFLVAALALFNPLVTHVAVMVGVCESFFNLRGL